MWTVAFRLAVMTDGPRVAGRVARPHGLRGEVAVEVLTSVPEERFLPGTCLIEVDGDRRFTVAAVRPHQGRLLVTFEEVTDRTGAEAIQGVLLAGEADVSAPEGEVWVDHFEGFAVLGTDGSALGVVRDVMANPAHELLVVTKADGSEALVPLVEAFVVDIDHEARTIVLDPPEGLL